MGDYKRLLLAFMAGLLMIGGLSGCNSKANEEEDVADAQKKLNEEKADLAKED
jgi:hypothetical protein